MTQAQLADGTILEFPDETSPDVIQKTVKSYISKQSGVSKSDTTVGAKVVDKKDPSLLADIEKSLGNSTVVKTLAELGGAGLKSVVDVVDFLSNDQINSVLEISGSDKRVERLGDMPAIKRQTEGVFMDEGLGRDVVRGAGEMATLGGSVGLLTKQAAKMLPKVAAGEGAGLGVAREITTASPVAEAGYGAVSGAGSEIGKQYGDSGGAVGAVVAPLAAGGAMGLTAPARQLASQGIDSGSEAVKNTFKSLLGDEKKAANIANIAPKLSDDGLAKLIARDVEASGMSPEEFVNKYKQLGDDGVLADVNENTRSRLRDAVNKVPRVSGRAKSIANERQAGASQRIIDSFEDSTGTSSLNTSDRITLLNEELSPRITELYAKARSENPPLSDRLNNLLNNTETDLGKARVAANTRLKNQEALGEKIGNIDIIDATKRELDDRIGAAYRNGENSKARELIQLKNLMVKEADNAVPEYKEARNLFAGKAALENSSETGKNFFKLKRSEIDELAQGMSESEKEMFMLGAKDAIIDKLDSTQINANQVNRLFGRNGDAAKLRVLFKDEASFNKFTNALQREAEFAMTRQAIQGNSSSVKQLHDAGVMPSITIDEAAEMATGSPIQWSKKVTQWLKAVSEKKGSAENQKALEEVGDLLLDSGLSAEKVADIIRRGNRAEIKNRIDQAVKRQRRTAGVAATTVEATSEANNGE